MKTVGYWRYGDRSVALASLATMVAAAALPTIGTCRTEGFWHNTASAASLTWFNNSTVIFFGWAGIIFLQPAWYANVILAATYLLALRGRRVPLALPLLMLALAFCLFVSVELPHNEAFAEYSCFQGIGVGAYMWFTAIIVNAVYFTGRSIKEQATPTIE